MVPAAHAPFRAGGKSDWLREIYNRDKSGFQSLQSPPTVWVSRDRLGPQYDCVWRLRRAMAIWIHQSRLPIIAGSSCPRLTSHPGVWGLIRDSGGRWRQDGGVRQGACLHGNLGCVRGSGGGRMGRGEWQGGG